ncbi:MAG: Fic family protein [Terriglobales bacterium]
MDHADFVPPAPQQLPQHLDAWDRYYHADSPDSLVQLAIVHAQFEFLHPFLDGNGRLGRLLIPLFLFEKKLLTRPAFYLSSYLERYREAYVGRLRAIGREPNAWQAWCEFFLDAVIAQAEANAEQVRQVQSLYELYKQRAAETTHSEFAAALIDAIFEGPIFSTTQVSQRPGMPSRSAVLALLDRMLTAGMLQILEPARGQRPQLWICSELLALCER